ncbi:hypothetical protein DFH09DRAFT_1150041, partial [Mycena vulgaris]
RRRMKNEGVGTVVYFPLPLSLSPSLQSASLPASRLLLLLRVFFPLDSFFYYSPFSYILVLPSFLSIIPSYFLLLLPTYLPAPRLNAPDPDPDPDPRCACLLTLFFFSSSLALALLL